MELLQLQYVKHNYLYINDEMCAFLFKNSFLQTKNTLSKWEEMVSEYSLLVTETCLLKKGSRKKLFEDLFLVNNY